MTVFHSEKNTTNSEQVDATPECIGTALSIFREYQDMEIPSREKLATALEALKPIVDIQLSFRHNRLVEGVREVGHGNRFLAASFREDIARIMKKYPTLAAKVDEMMNLAVSIIYEDF